MSQPTPSTAVNTLVELASNVANKQAEPEALHQVLNQRLEMLLASREDFEKKAEAMGEAFTIPHADLIDRVHECYDQYEQSLQTMLAYFDSGNAKDLHNGSKTLIEVTVPMTWPSMDLIVAPSRTGWRPSGLIPTRRREGPSVNSLWMRAAPGNPPPSRRLF